jgi:hypothetical protein
MRYIILFTTVIITAIQISCSNKPTQTDKASIETISDISKIDTTAVEEVSMQEKKPDFFELNQLMQKERNNRIQEFVLSENVPTNVVCKHGLKINVEPSNLILDDGTAATGKIKLQVIEAQTGTDFIINDAATICNGIPLNSGGSYYINLTNNGRQLHLIKNKSIQIEAPKINLANGMQLFYDTKANDSSIAWQATNISFTNKLNKLIFDESNYTGYNYIDSIKELKDKLFGSTNEKVFYKKNLTTIGDLVTLLNKDTVVMVIDTVYMKADEFSNKLIIGNKKMDTSNKYFVSYRIMNKHNLQEFKQAFAKRKALEAQNLSAYNEQQQKLKEQSNKEKSEIDYYAPVNITKLGWINCDKFLEDKLIPFEAELPITFNNMYIKHYIVFRSVNGFLLENCIAANGISRFSNRMPTGEKASIISIAEKDGEYYLAENKLIFDTNNKRISINFAKADINKIKEKLFSKS